MRVGQFKVYYDLKITCTIVCVCVWLLKNAPSMLSVFTLTLHYSMLEFSVSFVSVLF